jgi:hypothetical protein
MIGNCITLISEPSALLFAVTPMDSFNPPFPNMTPIHPVFDSLIHPFFGTFMIMPDQAEPQELPMSSQLESQDSRSVFDSGEPLPSSSSAIDADDSQGSESDGDSDGDDSPSAFSTSPNKRYAIWKYAQRAQWEAWWAEKLQGNANRLQFESIAWAKPKRSAVWNLFYQAAEIKTGLPKAVCQTCWKAYAHPELRKGGSSTSTLSRHHLRCRRPETQKKITQLGVAMVSQSFFYKSNGKQ